MFGTFAILVFLSKLIHRTFHHLQVNDSAFFGFKLKLILFCVAQYPHHLILSGISSQYLNHHFNILFALSEDVQ